MLALALVLLPLAAALAAVALPRHGAWLALAAAAANAAASGYLLWRVLAEGPLTLELGAWAVPLGIALRADGLSAVMVAMVAVVVLAVSTYGRAYLGERQAQRFWPLWMALWAALNALFLAGDAFNLYVTLELMSLAAVALVALAGERDALRGAARYLLAGLTGSLLYLLGVALLYGAYGVLDLGLLSERAAPGTATAAALALMSAGLLLKTAIFPQHFWLPPAHAGAPAPVSAALSALVVKAGFYILLRLWFEVLPAAVTPQAAQLVGALGAGAVIWGSLQALFAARLKLLVAYSTVAQLGYLMLAIPLGGVTAWGGALYLALSHALAKSALFLGAGALIHAHGHDRIDELGGAGRGLPAVPFALGLAAASLIGLPPTGGFIGKWLLLNAALVGGQWWWLAVLLLGSLLAAAYLFRILARFLDEPALPAGLPLPAAMHWTPLLLALGAWALAFVTVPLLGLAGQGLPLAGPWLQEMAP